MKVVVALSTAEGERGRGVQQRAREGGELHAWAHVRMYTIVRVRDRQTDRGTNLPLDVETHWYHCILCQLEELGHLTPNNVAGPLGHHGEPLHLKITAVHVSACEGRESKRSNMSVTREGGCSLTLAALQVAQVAGKTLLSLQRTNICMYVCIQYT